MERFSDAVANCLSTEYCAPSNSRFNQWVLQSYQEKIHGMVRGAALELCASFGLRGEGNIGIFMAILIHWPFCRGWWGGSSGGIHSDVLEPWESHSGCWAAAIPKNVIITYRQVLLLVQHTEIVKWQQNNVLQPLDAPCSWNSGHGALLSWLGPLTLVWRVRFAASWYNLCFNHLIEEWLCQMQNSEKIVQDSWESQHLSFSVAHLSFQSSLKMFPCPLGFSLPWNKICKCMFEI